MRYRLRGEILQQGSETVALFDVRKPKIFSSRYDMEMPWAVGFGEGYYKYRSSRLSGAPMSDTFSEYDTEPGLQPTMPEAAGENVQLLIENFQNGGGTSCDSTNILD